MTTLAQKRLPSLRTRQPSASNLPDLLRLAVPAPARRSADLPCIEAREVRPDDFLGLVAFDALGTRVPVRDAAFGIEHENGVVGDAGATI